MVIEIDGKTKMQNHNGRMVTRSFVFCLLAGAGVIADQLLKNYIFVQRELPKYMTQFKNYNFAFSLPLPLWLMYVIYTGVLLLALQLFIKHFSYMTKTETFGWVLLFSGAVSNIYERISLGYVRDYFIIGNGIFNLADAFIIAGILIVVLFPSFRKRTVYNTYIV